MGIDQGKVTDPVELTRIRRSRNPDLDLTVKKKPDPDPTIEKHPDPQPWMKGQTDTSLSP